MRICTRRSGSRAVGVTISNEVASPKMVVLAPMATAIEMAAAASNNGCATSDLKE